jgi:double-stranded uracil-DNA glycosylase
LADRQGISGTLSVALILPDILADGLRLVFCGTAPSKVSAAAGAYYAHPGNRFWPNLRETGLIPSAWTCQDCRRLPERGLGLTDLNKQECGVDADLSLACFDREGFAHKMRAHRPAAIAFTSKKAASIFLGLPLDRTDLGRQADDWEGIALFVLPSPSGQARRFFRFEPWQQAAAFALRGEG